MKCTDWRVIPIALSLNMAITGVTLAETPVLKINPQFQPDPLVVRGTSGGVKGSDCGNIAAQPNQVIQLSESLPYLRLMVESAGQPTLLINGPSGRFCVLADRFSGGKPEFSGFWQAGKYSLYIGDRAQGQHPYTLSISRKNNSTP